MPTTAMAEKKRKAKSGAESRSNKKSKKHSTSKVPSKKGKGSKRTGPRLPSSLRKEIDRMNPRSSPNSDEDSDFDGGNDFYEYEEEIPQEESQKNRRFDRVENYEYELPDQFEDENVPSEDDEDDGDAGELTEGADGRVEEEDDERHVRMLQGITGMPSEAFDGQKKKNNMGHENELSHDVLVGESGITVQDLLGALQGKTGYSKLRKRVQHIGKNATSIQAPLPKVVRDRVERKVVSEQLNKEIRKWESSIKRNREAPTLYFNEDVELGFSTVGAIASEFEPRTEFEKKMALLIQDDKVIEAHKNDGSKLLELNKITPEEYMKDRNHIAKMRSLLFQHEMKKKRIKKIKSKTYHRMMKRDKLKAESVEMLMDPEAAKEQAKKLEFKRAEERLTLKHRNKSKWARRIIERGLDVQDEGTRQAFAEQLHQHELLKRKMNTMEDSSSSSDDSSGDEDEEDLSASLKGRELQLLAKAKDKTMKVLEDDGELPNSGVLSLPFMVRGMKRREEEAVEEAKLALQEYEQLENTDGALNSRTGTASGRMVFDMDKNKAQEPNKTKPNDNKRKIDNYYGNSDTEDDLDAKEDFDGEKDLGKPHLEELEIPQDSVFKNFDEEVGDPGPKTTYEVAIFASDSWKKIKNGKRVDTNVTKSSEVTESIPDNQDLQTMKGGEQSDSDSEGQMVDGILSLGPKDAFEIPSQAELIRQAFAGDDVEEEFEKDKLETLNEENPEPEKPALLPGWGQWTHVQQKKGLPSWMLKEHDDAKRKREEALKKRKDANLKHVIISEKLDKKTEKLHTKSLPFPFTSKEMFEQSMRMPIGPEFNPASAIAALNRPEVVKKAGVIINPIKFEEVSRHEKAEHHHRSGQKQQKTNRSKAAGGKNKKK